jgi:DNA-binding transcriptional MocR family regulator
LYEQVAKRIAQQVESGVFRTGERIPAVRALSRQLGVSIATVLQAYRLLEDQGVVEAKPQSGYYVRWRPRLATPSAPQPTTLPSPTTVSVTELARQVLDASAAPGVVQFGTAVPDARFIPVEALKRALLTAVRRLDVKTYDYAFPPGLQPLRSQIARRAIAAGCDLDPADIVITSGAIEAVTLSLRAVTAPGDTVVVESPTFYGLLQAIESMGLKALEIPADPQHGMSLDALQLALEQWPVKACLLITNFNNPSGSLLSDENKRRLVQALSARQIPLIEDDVYGELSFDGARPRSAKSYDEADWVIQCSSFSKSLAPGLRVGWLASRRFGRQLQHLKYISSMASATLPQQAMADFLGRGGYDHHLRQIRRQYAQQVAAAGEAVASYFPAGTRATQPRGGFVLWVELPPQVDSLQLFWRARAEGISVAPGPLFSSKGAHRNFMRLNCAVEMNQRAQRALMRLGALAAELAAA